MRALLLTLLAGGLPLLATAQTTDLYTDPRDGTLNDRYALGYFMKPRADEVAQGSVFLLPAWTPGTLQVAGRAKPLTLPLKYDVYNQEVRAKKPDGDSVAVPVAKVKEFTLAARRFVCYPAAALPPEVDGGCGELLYGGPVVQLLRFERKTLEKRAIPSSSYASPTTVPVLEAHTRYYLRWANGSFAAVRPRRASLEQALASQPAALAALKSRKGGIGDETQLAAAVAEIAPLLK